MLTDILFAVIIGGFVGMAAHVRKKGKIVMPRRTKKFIYLGFLEEVLTGSIAALLLVVSSGAGSTLRVVFVSIIAGFGGDAILRGLEFLRNDKTS
ncbi:hypothetical protein WQ57_02150 [Mesobacillus campisalis]|uniref:DUF4257 domain-containing protein n=1 Tax=Mesobacillus campisalis TaxID=1408103 RepID=A0A0M2SZA2_9BACI|nr:MULTISPECIES: DUF4257 domain-containing protein [Bacillaceae]KKK39513.1 hypothetical protein WQ57_02150 [Mesobacillus campisalis]